MPLKKGIFAPPFIACRSPRLSGDFVAGRTSHPTHYLTGLGRTSLATVARFETDRKTNAYMDKALEHFSHPGNLPGVHPNFIKQVNVLSKEGEFTAFEQDARCWAGRSIP